MKILSNLLERYSHIQAPDKTLKKAFVKAVDDCVNITLELKDISISGKTIKVDAPSVIKNEIRFNQQDILKHISAEVGDKNAVTAIF